MGHSADGTKASQIRVCQLFLLLRAVTSPASEFPWQGMVPVSWSPCKQSVCLVPSEISDRKTFLEISASTARKTAWPCCGGVRGSFKHGITVTLPVGTLFKPSYWIHKCNPCATALVPRGQEKKKSKEKKKKEGKKKECRYRYCIQRCISTGKLMSIKGLQAVC